jgi:PAS domain S-box-containing protein
MLCEPALSGSDVLRSALEAVPVGLYVVDRDRRIVLWSEGAEHVTGYLRQEVVGRSCRENLLEHCDAEGARVCETACPLTCAIQNGHASDRVLFLKHKNGHRVPVRVYATGLRDARGRVIGAMETFHEQAAAKTIRGNTTAAQFPLRSAHSVPDHATTLALLAEILAVARAHSTGCGVACVQLAHFERFKTLHTLAAANQMMDTMASSIAQMLRQTDHVGRWSEEQLLVILPGCHASALETVATRLAHVAHRSRIRWWGDELAAHVWVGGAMARAEEDAETVAARTAMIANSCANRPEQGNIVLIQN